MKLPSAILSRIGGLSQGEGLAVIEQHVEIGIFREPVILLKTRNVPRPAPLAPDNPNRRRHGASNLQGPVTIEKSGRRWPAGHANS
jgi:hypothetical protein